MIRFPFPLALSEVLKNLKSAPARTLAILGISLCVGAGVALSTITDVTRVTTAQAQQYLAGSSALVITVPEEEAISASRCHALSALGGVVSAGGIMSVDAIRLSILPSTDARLYTVTPGYIGAAWPEFPSPHQLSVIADSSHLTYGWSAGSTFTFTDSAGVQQMGRLDAVAQHPNVLQSGREIIAVDQPHGIVKSCVVLAHPASKADVANVARGWFGPNASITDALMGSSMAANPQDMFNERLSQFGWIMGGTVLVGLLISQWVARRSEFALYRLNHVSSSGIVTMFSLETLLLVLAPAQVGAAIAIGFSDFTALLGTTLLIDLLRLDLAIVLAPLLGLVVVPKGSLLATLKGN